MDTIKLGSLFDGSGGFPLAGAFFGIKPVWASEIEPYPIRVTTARFPDMKHLGDITKINGAEIEAVDIITFGSPCQDLSIAGKRLGLEDGERSNLFYQAVRIIKEMREATNGEYPEYAVWENVPGAFSSNHGKDFQAVLQNLCQVKDPNAVIPEPAKGKWQHAGAIVADGYSIAWRLYDAQYWGVPQRRKRIYLIADFTTDRAPQILFEQESLRGNIETGTAEREDPATDATGSVGRSCACELICVATQQGGAEIDENGLCPTVTASAGMSGNNQPYICAAIDGYYSVENHPNDSRVKIDEDGKVQTLSSRMGTGGDNVPMIMTFANQAFGVYKESEKASSLKSRDYKDATDLVVDRKYIVRRLTPLECCRLQGFPDWWTDGVDGSDAAQYKMWGNGIALPCAVDVIGRLHKQLTKFDRRE